MTTELNPRFTFEAFVVGEGNRLAAAAARSVAERPAATHNPLFVYSQTGLGKTHLLMAIGHAALEYSPALRVRYVTLDELVETYHDAVSEGQVHEFREELTGFGMLLVDDVQFLENRREMQIELLRLTETLQAAGAQVVLTSDRAPAEISDIDDQLLARIGGGLAVDMSEPDFETRLAILNRRAEERGVTLSPDVLQVVAEGRVRNIRELLGVLNRLIAFQAVSEHPLTPDAARALFAGQEDAPLGRSASDRPEPAPGDAPPSPSPDDEFGAFLSGIQATVSEQIQVWHGRVRDTIARWSAKGYRTDRLEALLGQDVPSDAEEVVRTFEADLARLRSLQHQIAECDPEMAGDPVFRDPDRISDAEELVQRARDQFEPPPGPSDAFALEDFFDSASTKMAVGAARAVIDQPGAVYNPLVIVGSSGVGKTHLLHAIGREMQMRRSGGWIACVSAQVLMDELVRAIQDNRVPTWRARYRRSTAFLLDNIDLIGARERIQDELFYLFNVLFDAGRQLVFTSSLPPREVARLDDRLVSRLEGGLVATLEPPDRDLRRAVAERQLRQRLGAVDATLAEFLADRPADSVRSVLGLVNRVLTAAEAQGVPATADLAREVVTGVQSRESDSAQRVRTSGALPRPSGIIASPEKMVWHWPNPSDGMFEELP